ncbi:glycosyl transferase [Flavimobilis marinus]|uniref:Uncharacterized protein n=1 Tax=Flavimobilis marinus TaxID=285351 RepID=A0A1I2I6M9_9MICO|nr:glycosyltransferase family 4 protein [Flavimobilis marinus]GHG56655.1 glycosyl transferase [Flavimobilis marinus]SFF37293.1 hypothetical protein SAMN04488035_2711 [Flavimobilis marinus]
MPAATRHVLVAHPSADLYGSDRQLVESVRALVEVGVTVTVTVPAPGPLCGVLREAGADVVVVAVPVLRKALLNPRGLVGLALGTPAALVRLVRLVRRLRPGAVYVNTLTIPHWTLAARLTGTPVLVHVHEAEEEGSRLVRQLLVSPLLLAHRVLVNSAAARAATALVPGIDQRCHIVYNGVPGPPSPQDLRARVAGDRALLVLVARLSPRKGVDVALEAVARLVAEGRDVRLTVCGTAFAGYEWFEDELRARAAQADLAGRLTFAGYVHPTWRALADSDVVLVPSRAEPFGNTAVEAMRARRPVVASRVQGLREIVEHGRTGLLVTPGSADELAAAVRSLLDDPALGGRLAAAGEAAARTRFAPERYRAEIRSAVAEVARSRRAGHRRR